MQNRERCGAPLPVLKFFRYRESRYFWASRVSVPLPVYGLEVSVGVGVSVGVSVASEVAVAVGVSVAVAVVVAVGVAVAAGGSEALVTLISTHHGLLACQPIPNRALLAFLNIQ